MAECNYLMLLLCSYRMSYEPSITLFYCMCFCSSLLGTVKLRPTKTSGDGGGRDDPRLQALPEFFEYVFCDIG